MSNDYVRKLKELSGKPAACDCFIKIQKYITGSGHSPKCHFHERYLKKRGFASGTRNDGK